MKFLLNIILLVSLLNIPTTAQTKYSFTVETRTRHLPFGLEENVSIKKPVTGLVLSGGGARGFAQIGVIKALEEAGISFEVIAGTSMGSIIGGLYAAGYSVDEIDSITTVTDWDELLSIQNIASRKELFIDQKVTEDRAIFTLRLDGLTPIIPTSFNEGLRLSNYLSLLTMQAPIHPCINFDDLMYRYRAVCTNLVNGEPVILSSGPLGRAMRASSSVTFFLSPVEWDSLTLVDGGLVSNIPVETAESMGAEFIIAVNTTSPLNEEEQLGTPWMIADQTVSIPMKILNKLQLSKADVVISPNINYHQAADFNGIDSLIKLGYESTLPLIEKIKSKIASFSGKKIRGKEIIFKNIKPIGNPPDLEKPYFDKYAGKGFISNYEIISDLNELFETGNYKNLKAEIIQYDDSSTIRYVYELNPVISEVTVYNNIIHSEDTLNLLFRDLIGKPYNSRKILDKVINSIKYLKKKGYLLTGVSSVEFRDGNLTINFDGGTISEIVIESNTDRNIILREFPVRAGDQFVYEKVKAGLNDLRSTGLFDDINLFIKTEENKNILVIKVREIPSSLLKVGFLVNNVYNAQLGLDLREINLFGSGTELGLFIFGGASNRAYILEHSVHRIFESYLTYKANVFYNFNDVNVYRRDPSPSGDTFKRNKIGKYRQIFYGAALSLGTQIEKFGKLIFTGKYQLDEVKNKQGETVNPYKTKIVSLKIGATIDSKNKYPYPDEGFYFDGFYETAQSLFGGDEGFIVVGLDMKYFYKLQNHHVLIPRFRLGFGDRTLPISQQFIMGGQHSFFGVHENEFRGRQVFLASLAYQYKLPFKIFFDTYLWFRYDLGSTWEVQEQIRFKDLQHGFGGTLSFDTPIGPADFSVGRSFLLRKGLSEGSVSWGEILFYFSIGHAVTF